MLDPKTMNFVLLVFIEISIHTFQIYQNLTVILILETTYVMSNRPNAHAVVIFIEATGRGCDNNTTSDRNRLLVF